MFLNIEGKFTEKFPEVSIDDLRNKFVQAFLDSFATVTINQNGDIEWKAWNRVFGWNVSPVTTIRLKKGKNVFKENIHGGIDIHYNVSLLPWCVLLTIMLSILIPLFYVFGKMPLFVAFMSLFIIWIILNGTNYIITKIRFKVFIKKRKFSIVDMFI